ncbi:hypothetical protein PsPphi15_gp50 [Pseudomonas phage phi15]|uniref:Uncharacterized protein n=2 Tax=Troedvirus TaxID=2732694 RepID=F0V711_9CAUD|nr:hypothetical protein PsPphi15_gp50 [Pseudomonas phage phi15]CBZ42023.1 hypothetical protein [Pseudomonas phage phi15]
MTMTGKRTVTALAVLVALAKNKATYKFLGVLLVALGVANGETIMTGVMTVACAFLGCV